MKKLMAAALLAIVSLTFPYCSDKGDDNPEPPDPCSETKLAVTTTPAINTTAPAQVSPDFPVTINITAGFPAAGATINVTATNEANNTKFFEANPTTVTAGANNVTITNTPAGSTAVVQVTVTSKNCPTNKWTGTFRYLRK